MPSGPIYYPKIISITGEVIAAPLEVASVEFTDTIFVPGQHRLGEFTLTLLNTRDRSDLRATYALLSKRQRVEIYEHPDLLGDPVFAGVLQRPTKDLEGNRQWRGNRYDDWLDRRRLGAYQQLVGNPGELIRDLCKSYQSVFMDDFNRTTGIGADWTIIAAGGASWTIADGHLAETGFAGTIETTASYDFGKDTEIAFDFNTSVAHGGFGILFPYTASHWEFLYVAQIQNGSGGWSTVDLWSLDYDTTTPGTNPIGFRFFSTVVDSTTQWNRLQIRTKIETANRRIVVYLNGLELFNLIDTNRITGNATVRLYGSNINFDNFILAQKTAVLTPGKIAASSSTFDRQFNGDSQLAAIEAICESEGWEYRIRARAGAGNDIIDVGPSVGVDFSGDLTLEDGKNIESLNVDDSDEELATVLHVSGQSRDDALSSFVSTNLSAITTYGILESEYSDPRVQDSAIAKAIGDVRLARLSAGNISIQGKIIDESGLLRQEPILGAADLGDFVLGGRDRFAAGDTVWLKSADLEIDKLVKFVSLTRRSGEINPDVVFDYHMWRASDDERNLRRQVEMLQRSLDQRIDSQSLVFSLSGTTPLTLSFNMRGNLYKAVYLDVTSAAWAGSITIAVDGVDRTLALFGAASISANAFAQDTAYLVLSGVHTITLTPTMTVTVTVAIRPMLYG